MDFLLKSMDEFMFRSSLRAAKERSDELGPELTSQSLEFQQKKPVLRHKTNKTYASTACVLMLFGILAALSLLVGCWTVDHAGFGSISPITVAWAFRSPVLGDQSDDEHSIDEMLKRAGRIRVAKRRGQIFRVGESEGDAGEMTEERTGSRLLVQSLS
jgi:hypothetical protein